MTNGHSGARNDSPGVPCAETDPGQQPEAAPAAPEPGKRRRRNSWRKEPWRKAYLARSRESRAREFALWYLRKGSASEAMRRLGYRGRYPAQAGYKLLARPAAVAEIQRLRRFDRLTLRAAILRVLVRVRRALVRGQFPESARRQAGEMALTLAQAVGLAEDATCQALAQWLEHPRPRLRRLYRREWEEPGDPP